MIGLRLRLALIAVTLLSTTLVIRISRTARMEAKDATNWLLVALFLLLSSIAPELIAALAGMLGMELASNAAFAMVLFLLLAMVFYLNIRISKLSVDNRHLVQNIALLEKQLRDKGLL